MNINVNDTENLPTNILQIELKNFPFLTVPFLDEIIKRKEIGIKKDKYYMINTLSNVSWLQPTQQLILWHQFLFNCASKGFKLLMIKI